MDYQTLKRANELVSNIQTIDALRDEFNKEYPAVNQIGSCGLTEQARTEWINANIAVLDELREQAQREFEEL